MRCGGFCRLGFFCEVLGFRRIGRDGGRGWLLCVGFWLAWARENMLVANPSKSENVTVQNRTFGGAAGQSRSKCWLLPQMLVGGWVYRVRLCDVLALHIYVASNCRKEVPTCNEQATACRYPPA